ncbi:MAG: hypothetical protein R2729_10820 [Bryobacteraceae bacterium]
MKTRVNCFVALLALQISFSAKPAKKAEPAAEIVSLRKVWDLAPHNAFTDLVRFQERWFLAFREGGKHASSDGSIRILTSADADTWQTASVIRYPVADLRDPKIVVTPERKLMLTTAGAMHQSDAKHKTFAWFSINGRDWTDPVMIGDPNIWLWRVQWHRNKAYGLGYSTVEPHLLRSYVSANGEKFQTLNPAVIEGDYANESSILFLPDDTALCLLRRDPKTALLGRSRPPYRGWEWKDTGVRVGGPHMLRLDDGRIVASVRLYDDRVRTSLCWVNPEDGTLTEFLALPSGGDTSYAGLAFHDELLHVSYYSSHEGRTSIYLAKVKLP